MKWSIAYDHELFFALHFGDWIQQDVIQTTSLIMSSVLRLYLRK